MHYRTFAQRSRNTVLNVLYTDERPFAVPAEQHLAAASRAFGIPLDDLDVFEGVGEPPDVSGGLPPLPVEPTPREAALERLRALAATKPEIADVLAALGL